MNQNILDEVSSALLGMKLEAHKRPHKLRIIEN